MAGEISGGSCCSPWSEFSRDNAHVQDAYQVFDGMTRSDFEDWRPPNRSLEVTIHKVCYPITESVLCQVFGSFGVVEHVHLLGGSDHVSARVVFHSKNDAADAFGELHGRYLYAGCCQLDIKWGLFQECEVAMEKSRPNTIASMTLEPDFSVTMSKNDTMADGLSMQFASATTAMSILNKLGSEQLPVEASAIGEHIGIAAVTGGSIVTVPLVAVSDVVDCDVDDELPVPAVAAIAKEDIINTSVAPTTVLVINAIANDVTIAASTICSSECRGTVVCTAEIASTSSLILTPSGAPTPSVVTLNLNFFVHANLTAHQKFKEMLSGSNFLFSRGSELDMLVKAPCKCLPSGGRIDNCELQRGCLPLDMHLESIVILWPLLRKLVEQLPWPPPAELEAACDDAELRPSPWPSFNLAEGVNVGWYFSLLGKTPRPPSIQNPMVQREFQWFLHWTYGATRFFDGDTNYAAMPLCQIFMFLLQKHGDDLLACKNEVQSFMSASTVQFLECMILSSMSTQAQAELDSQWYMDMLVRAPFELPQKLLKFLDTAVLITQLNIMQDFNRMLFEPWYYLLCNASTHCLLKGNCEILSTCEILVRNIFGLLLIGGAISNGAQKFVVEACGGVSISVDVPMPQIFVSLQLKLVCTMGCLLAKTDCEMMRTNNLLRLSHSELSVQVVLISMLANGSTSYCYSRRDLHHQPKQRCGGFGEHIYARSIIAFSSDLVIFYKIQNYEHSGDLGACRSWNLISSISAIHLVGYGKNLVFIIHLLLVWDSGGVVFNLMIQLYRLGGKPKLKKGGMLETACAWAIIWLWAMTWLDPAQIESTRGATNESCRHG